ncbi:MAG: hypothetical protein R3323_10040 [Wenzhouxiangellaceae bacterium]|nr:hypothetical protein [Wenzhouxiangellaceae bacterium]
MNQAAVALDGTGTPEASGRFRVPLLHELVESLDAARRHVWADLGRVNAGLVERLQPGRSRIDVLALQDDVASADRPLRLPRDGSAPDYEVLLCWDLPNYMDADALASLADFARRHCAPGCAVHALVHYSEATMPEQPADFLFLPPDGLEARERSSTRVQAPRPSPKALEKSLPGLVVDETRLLNNGMQEFVLRPAVGT